MKRGNLLVLIIVFVLQSCIQSKICPVIGYYRSIGDKQKVVHTLKLLPDSTFIYKMKGDLIDSESMGRWYSNKGNIYLRSFDTFKPEKYTVNTTTDSLSINSETLYLQISDQYNNPLPYTYIEYGGFKTSTDFTGRVQLKELDADSLVVKCFAGTFIIHSGFQKNLLNNITLYVMENTFYLNDESFQIRQKKLYSSWGKVFQRLK